VKGEPEKKKESTSEEPARDRAERIPPGLASPSFIRGGRFVLDDLIGIGTAPPVGVNAVPGFFGIVRGVAGYSSANGADGLGGNATTHSMWLSPSGDYFLGSHLSIGARASGTFSESQTTGATSRAYGGALVPRVGYFSPIGASSGVWLRGGLGGGFQTSQTTTTGIVLLGTAGETGGLGAVGGTTATGGLGGVSPGPGSLSTTSTLHYWTAQADASYLVALGEHLLVAAGPEAGYVYYTTDGNTQTSGSRFNVGGRVSLGATF
jgi:hypothetical protein